MSDHGYLLIQAIFQALQLYSWGFALIKLFRSRQRDGTITDTYRTHKQVICRVWACRSLNIAAIVHWLD